MKLTCLSKGGNFYYPPCHMLDLCGFRVLLECPLDLSALSVFAPIPYPSSSSHCESTNGLGCAGGGESSSLGRRRKRRNTDREEEDGEGGVTKEDLIRAVPWYKTVASLHQWDASLIDVVLVSSPMGMLGLPFLTRNSRFNAKVYATEAAVKFGRLMMEELVSLHSEFIQYYGPDEDLGYPEWMKEEEIERLPHALWQIVMGQEEQGLGSWLPLYSAEDIDGCMKKIQGVKYAEECVYDGILILKPLSSGLEFGTANWTICGPRRTVTYLSSSIFKSSHAASFDYQGLQGNDLIIFSDFSPLSGSNNSSTSTKATEQQVQSEGNDNYSNCPLVRGNSSNYSELVENLIDNQSSDELEKLSFICSCIINSVKEGGSVLIPIGRLGVILQLLELISRYLELSDLKVPIYIISAAAEESLAFVNAMPEWVSKDREQKLYSGEALFGHMELIKEKKLQIYSALHSSSLLMSWQEPCIVFSPHWSLRLGPVVQLLHRWHGDQNSLLVVEEGVDADTLLSPFKPVALKVLQCSFLSGIMVEKVQPLLHLLQPKLVLFPEDLRALIPSSETIGFSFSYYIKNTILHVPRLKEDFEACLSTNLALQLQPKRMPQENVAIARLQGGVCLKNRKFVLVPAKKSIKCQHKKLHWGSVNPTLLLTALQERGINASIHKDDTVAESDVFSIHVNGAEIVMIQLCASHTVIAAADEKLAAQIYEAFCYVSEGI